jgi:formylglycine-generating enzyme required for sulfatase activity/serine/threonine protein kinase
MAAWHVWLSALGSAIWQEVPQALLGFVPFGENIGRIAERFWENLREKQEPAKDKAALEQLVNAPPEEVKAEAKAVADAVAPEAPPEVRSRLAATLEMAAPLSRRVLSRSEDPEGKTVPGAMRLDGPLVIGRFIPQGPPRFQEGTPFQGWVLRERLGVGGFSEVWKIAHPRDEELTAAVKFFTGDEARGKLGEHEVAVLRQVRRLGAGTGMVRLEDFDEKADPPWIRFEFVPGGDLIRHARQFSGAKSTALIRELAEIVGTCHRLSPPVVHRDLKPGNVLMRHEGGRLRPVIADFGIGGVSAAVELEKARTTRPTAVLPTILSGSHTALYASPQQVAGEKPDPRDDVYALGVMWYQFAIGDLSSGPPTGLEWAEELKELGLSDGLVRLLGACVEPKKLEKRPKDAAELAEKIGAAMGQAAKTETQAPQPQAQPQSPPSTGRKLGGTQGTMKQQVEQAHTQAGDFEKAGEYERAAKLIAAVPEHLQQPGYLISLLDRAAEATALEAELSKLDREGRLEWKHRAQIRRLKELVPLLDVSALLADARETPARFTCPTLNAPMVRVPPGEFWMGGHGGKCGKQHVVIDMPFYMGVYPVTQGHWRHITGKNPSYFCKGGPHNDKVRGLTDAEVEQFPVERVSWDDVQKFLAELNAREKDTASGWVYRLPTEEEWEFACRSPVPSGDQSAAQAHCSFSFYTPHPTNSLSSAEANFAGRLGRPTKVGSYPPNGLGIHDLHGNVWEWTHTSGRAGRLICGGSWDYYGHGCAAEWRDSNAPGDAVYSLGFRLVRVPA